MKNKALFVSLLHSKWLNLTCTKCVEMSAFKVKQIV